ncbi:MAG: DNA polymerase/3'-5' exonuclease PolX [Actinomycetota bacterium]
MPGTRTNQQVIAMLDELVRLTTLDEESPQSFKVRAYEKAKLGVEAHGDDVAELTAAQLTKIDGIGKATAAKIREFLDTGAVDKLERLRADYPPEFAELAKIPGLGPKTLKLVRRELGVEDLDGLRSAIAEEKLRTLKGLGATREAKIAKAIERLGLTGKDRRTPIAEALPLAHRIVADLEALPAATEVEYCGSLRRMAETIGDIDITVAADEPSSIMAAVVDHPEAAEIVLTGDTKTSFLTSTGLQVDVRVVEPHQFGAATLYFTGSRAHNIALRQRAINRGWLLNEYGLLDGDTVIASATEEAIYEALGLAFVPPPMREGTGEIPAAAASAAIAIASGSTGSTTEDERDPNDRPLPDLVELDHIQGDLHYHTDRSGDGRSPLGDMVAVAAAKGYRYLAITDHGEDLAINGSNREEMLEHREKINALQGDYPDMVILWGCELNIGPDGGLDYDDEFRALFDYTVASVHSHFDQDVSDQTRRIVRAIEDQTVNSIGHLTGRYIGRRPGIELDIPTVLDALVANDVALEINGALDRLDAASDVVRRAVDRGVKLVINTDSHHVSELGRMEYGVRTAQRGWTPRELVINTWTQDDFLRWARSRS